MKVLGIIAEYNPFHNGHLYHFKKSKELTSADATVAVISGNFTQRGSTSLIDKWKKAKMALNSGVDLVIELPTLYSLSSAENFAEGGIKILDSLGIVNFLSFGAEENNISLLEKIADILLSEPKEYKDVLASELKKGTSFPKARQIAVSKYLKTKSNILEMPNNILGIEYLKALKKCNSRIEPIAISRVSANYNDVSFTGSIASATAIRELVKSNKLNDLKNLMPKYSYDTLLNCDLVPDITCFEKEIIYTLRKMDINEISLLPDVSEGLEFTIKKAANSYNKLNELLNNIKSKRYTYTRLQRILLYAMLRNY